MIYLQLLFSLLILSRVASEGCRNTVSNITTNDSNNVGHYFVQVNALEEMITLLMNERELAFAVDRNRWTPLHEAARSANVLMIALLVENGADALAKTVDCLTPRDVLLSLLPEVLAEHNNYSANSYTLAELILRQAEEGKGLNGHVINKESLCYSKDAIVNFPGLAKRLTEDNLKETLEEYFYINGGIIEETDDNRWTLLHEAARSGNVEILSFLIDNGGNLFAKNVRGETALDVARRYAFNGNSRMHDEAVHILANNMRMKYYSYIL